MPTEEEFLKPVLAAPEDDAPRLIMADWLDEQGQGDRAEFIRYSCVMASHTDCPVLMKDRAAGRPRPFRCGSCEYCVARQRCDSYKDRFQWTVECGLPFGTPYSYCLDPGLDLYLPPNHEYWHFLLTRGFIESVTCSAEDWLRHAGRVYDPAKPETWKPGTILSSQPVRKVVVLTTAPPCPEDMNPEAWPELVVDFLQRSWPGIEFTLPRYGPSLLRGGYRTWQQMQEELNRRSAARQPYLIGRI